jgi:hypothetical protein
MSVVAIPRLQKEVPWICPPHCNTSIYTNVGRDKHGKYLFDKHFGLVIGFRGLVRDTAAGRKWGDSGVLFPTVHETSCVAPVQYNSLHGTEFLRS